MIAVLAYWLLLFLLLLPGGLLLKHILKLQNDSIPMLLLLGMLYYTTGFTVAALFVPLGWETLLFLTIAPSVAALAKREQIVTLLFDAYAGIKETSGFTKITLALLFIGALFKSAQLPSIIDNETYYLQTIKWLNEYGFVTGLGNLHLFLAQQSPWHLLQAGLNLNFLSGRFNDINGFLFITCTCYYLAQAKDYKVHWLTLLPALSFIFFLFIDAPSPDLPLLMITPIVVHQLMKEDCVSVKTAWLLFLLIAFIKVTIAPLGIVFLYPLVKDRKLLTFFAISGCSILLLWMAKNILISGYPFYPFTTLATDADWQIPTYLINGVGESSNRYIYGAAADAPMIIRLKSWLLTGGTDGLFNKMAVVLFLVMPLFRKIRQHTIYRLIYLGFLLQFLLLLFTSPQFRFFLPAIVFFSAFIAGEIFAYFTPHMGLYKPVLAVGIIGASLTLLLPAGQEITTRRIITPGPASRYSETEFVKRKAGNLNYYSPANNFFFYGTADGPLPCINEVQLKYFEKKYRVRPQMRSNELQDGFYSEDTTAR
jgi:hypothetical protein